jgi:hypothetical protein
VGDVNRVTDLFNTFAAKAHDAGMVAVLHNEGFEVPEELAGLRNGTEDGIVFEQRVSSMKSFKQSATYFPVEAPED